MAVVVTAASGYDLTTSGKTRPEGDAQRQAEGSKGGYYINAAEAGEAPGRWFGKGAEALGFTPGQEVEREPYDEVYEQVDPRDGTKLGRAPGGYKTREIILDKLLAAEPHATGERVAELERLAVAGHPEVTGLHRRDRVDIEVDQHLSRLHQGKRAPGPAGG